MPSPSARRYCFFVAMRLRPPTLRSLRSVASRDFVSSLECVVASLVSRPWERNAVCRFRCTRLRDALIGESTIYTRPALHSVGYAHSGGARVTPNLTSDNDDVPRVQWIRTQCNEGPITRAMSCPAQGARTFFGLSTQPQDMVGEGLRSGPSFMRASSTTSPEPPVSRAGSTRVKRREEDGMRTSGGDAVKRSDAGGRSS